jgi:hypothetical protein
VRRRPLFLLPEAGEQTTVRRGVAATLLAQRREQRVFLWPDAHEEARGGKECEHDQRCPVAERQPDQWP